MEEPILNPVDQIKRPEVHTYFETAGEQMIKDAGMTKAQFCKKVGVEPGNLPKLFKTKNAVSLNKVSKVLGVPLDVLVDGERKDYYENLSIVGCVRVNDRAFLINNETDLKNLVYNILHYQI